MKPSSKNCEQLQEKRRSGSLPHPLTQHSFIIDISSASPTQCSKPKTPLSKAQLHHQLPTSSSRTKSTSSHFSSNFQNALDFISSKNVRKELQKRLNEHNKLIRDRSLKDKKIKTLEVKLLESERKFTLKTEEFCGAKKAWERERDFLITKHKNEIEAQLHLFRQKLHSIISTQAENQNYYMPIYCNESRKRCRISDISERTYSSTQSISEDDIIEIVNENINVGKSRTRESSIIFMGELNKNREKMCLKRSTGVDICENASIQVDDIELMFDQILSNEINGSDELLLLNDHSKYSHANTLTKPTPINVKSAPTISERLFSILGDCSSLEFEFWIKFLYEAKGYQTEHVGGCGDHGIDIRLQKDNKLSIVQCKQYSRKNVPERDVRELLGAVSNTNENASCGIMVTTMFFSKASCKFAEAQKNSNIKIKLVDQNKLRRYLEKYQQSMLSLRDAYVEARIQKLTSSANKYFLTFLDEMKAEYTLKMCKIPFIRQKIPENLNTSFDNSGSSTPLLSNTSNINNGIHTILNNSLNASSPYSLNSLKNSATLNNTRGIYFSSNEMEVEGCENEIMLEKSEDGVSNKAKNALLQSSSSLTFKNSASASKTSSDTLKKSADTDIKKKIDFGHEEEENSSGNGSIKDSSRNMFTYAEDLQIIEGFKKFGSFPNKQVKIWEHFDQPDFRSPGSLKDRQRILKDEKRSPSSSK